MAAAVVCASYGVTPEGNFEDSGATVLSEVADIESVASALSISVDEAMMARGRGIAKLYLARDERPRPFRDEKVLASWNGLMISACAELALSVEYDEALQMAVRALDAVVARLWDGERLLRLSPPDGSSAHAKVPGFLDDYAFLANAALDVYEATAGARHVELARGLVNAAINRFGDPEGGFFFTPNDGETLLHRQKDPWDHAIPSGVSMMCLALLRLHSLDGDARYEKLAHAALAPLASAAEKNPLGFGQTVIAVDRLVMGPTEIVVVGSADDPATAALLTAARESFVPHRTIAFVDPANPATAAACPALAEGKAAKDHPVAYVCRARTCSPPIGDALALRAALRP